MITIYTPPDNHCESLCKNVCKCLFTSIFAIVSPFLLLFLILVITVCVLGMNIGTIVMACLLEYNKYSNILIINSVFGISVTSLCIKTFKQVNNSTFIFYYRFTCLQLNIFITGCIIIHLSLFIYSVSNLMNKNYITEKNIMFVIFLCGSIQLIIWCIYMVDTFIEVYNTYFSKINQVETLFVKERSIIVKHECKSEDECKFCPCSICIEKMKEEEEIVELECKHLFHKKCIRGWIHKHNICPNCRSEV